MTCTEDFTQTMGVMAKGNLQKLQASEGLFDAFATAIFGQQAPQHAQQQKVVPTPQQKLRVVMRVPNRLDHCKASISYLSRINKNKKKRCCSIQYLSIVKISFRCSLCPSRW